MEETNSTKILVVVDLQNDFVTGALGTQEAQAIVPRVCVKTVSYTHLTLPTICSV